MHVESNKTKTFRPLLLCMINTPHGLSEYTNIWVHPIKTFLWQHILRIPFFYIRPKNRLHFYTPCQVLVINLDKTSSMAKFSWSFVRWAMLQPVNWVILPSGMMQNTLQLIMPQVCHITCSAILPALTLCSEKVSVHSLADRFCCVTIVTKHPANYSDFSSYLLDEHVETIASKMDHFFTCLTPVEPKIWPLTFPSITTKRFVVDRSNYTFSESL